MNSRRLLTATFLAVALAAFAPAPDGPEPASTPGPGEPTLSEVRRHRTVPGRKVALAEG